MKRKKKKEIKLTICRFLQFSSSLLSFEVIAGGYYTRCYVVPPLSFFVFVAGLGQQEETELTTCRLIQFFSIFGVG